MTAASTRTPAALLHAGPTTPCSASSFETEREVSTSSSISGGSLGTGALSTPATSDFSGERDMTNETAGDMLERLGADAMAWAREFIEQYPDVDLLGGALRDDAAGVMVGWFANAMVMAELAGYNAGMMAQAGMTPPDTSADDTSWDSRNHPDRVTDYVPCDDPWLEHLMHPYGSEAA